MKLVKTGQPDIPATNVRLLDDGTLLLDLDLTGAVLGDWDIWLTNPDGQVAILPAAFEVQDRTPPKVTGLDFTSGASLSIQPAQLTATLNEDVDPASVTAATVVLSRAGVDGVLNTADDVVVTSTSLAVENGNQIKVDLSATVLPDDRYQLLISGADPWMIPYHLPDLNTSSSEQVVSVSQDGLELFFFSDRSGGAGDWDLYTCTRPDTSSEWSAPINISELNTTGYEGHPVISASGLTLYFTSIRNGGLGNADLWMATRPAKGSPWTNPVNIAELNSSALDQVPIVSNDELDIWFLNDTTGGTTGHDIYHASRLDTASPWSGRAKVTELNTNFFECVTWISPDKLTMYMTSNRTGTKGVLDVWRSSRPSLIDPWTTPQNISDLNTTTDDGGFMAISADGNTLWLSSKRSGGKGNWDILQTNAGSPVKDVHGNALDGEFTGTFPSGNDQPGGHFIAGFTLDHAPVAHDMNISSDEDVIYAGTLDATDSSASLTYSIVTNGSLGTATVTNAATGAFTYTPLLNVSGVDTFTFKLNDGISDSNVAAVTVTINSRNDLPLAVVGGLVTFEDIAGSGTMIALDAEGDPLTFSIVSNGSLGTAVLDDASAGTFTYTPNPETWGLDTITFIANDGAGDSNEASITIQILEVKDAPVASDGTLETDEDVSASGTLVASDVDSPWLTYSIVTNGTKGTVVVTDPATGAYTYTPALNANGADSFTFVANDGDSDSNAATITVIIYPVNDAPVASDGSKSTPEDTALTATLSAFDVEADGLTFSIVANGTKGTAVITNANTGAYTYTPNQDANGTDTFTFKAKDGTADSNTATITIAIQPLNDLPIAADDTFLTLEDTPFLNTLTAVDVDGDGLTYSLVSNGTKGSAVITNPATGAFAYAPSANQNGTDTFTFKVNDGSVNSNTATVTVTIVAVNDTPIASDGSASTEQDTPVGGQCLASDADGDTLTYILVSNGSLGSVSITGSTGGFVYTPNPGQAGIDSFTFKVNDGTVDSNEATITVDVGEVNHPPVASDGSGSTLEDVVLSGTLLASDEDGPGLFFSIVTNGTRGTASITNALTGAFTYTPAANANGSDSFTFKAYDGELYSNEATIFVTIAAVNDPPVALAASVETDEDTAYDGVLAGTDVEGDGLAYAVVSNGTKGTVVVTNASTGAFTYMPNANANGNDSFTFKVNDGLADSSPTTVSITIAAVNDAPVAQDGASGTTEDTAVDGKLVASDTEGDGLAFEVVANGAKGTAVVTNASTGAFTYTPNANVNGADSFTFKAFDGQDYSNTSTVNVTIGAVNDKPVADADAITTDEDTPYSGGLGGSDVENQPLTFSIVSNGAKGTAVITDASTGAFTYMPNNNANGSDSFTFKVNDGLADSSPATISVTIQAVNDAPTAQASTVGTPEDTPLDSTLSASDVENDGLTYTLVTNGSKGSAAITNSATGAFTYTPDANANGSDLFTFKVNDGSADSNTATVTVNISPVNDVPTASIPAPGPYSVAEGVAFAFAGSGVDIEDGSNLTYGWNWDDSTPNGTAQNPSHVWNAPGTYTVSLVATDQDGMPSNPVSVQVNVTPKAGERDLYLKKSKFAIDWKAHESGLDKDSFSVQGCLNPAGCNAALTGATFELSIEGVSLGVVPLAKTGKGSAGIGNAIAKASLKAKTGAFSYSIKSADLADTIGLANTTEAGALALTIEVTILGAGLDTETFAAHALFTYSTIQSGKSKGSFNYKTDKSMEGYFIAAKTMISEDKAGAHTVSAKGYFETPGNADLAPIGNITLTIGAQVITIPSTNLNVADSVITLPTGAHPDLEKFIFYTNKRSFAILSNALVATGVPLAGDLATSHELLLRIEFPTVDDLVTFESTVEILRSSFTSKKWKR